MTGAVIPPVAFRPRPDGGVVGSPSVTSAPRRALPLPALPQLRTSGVVYGMAAVDCRGRVADRSVLAALGWTPGTNLNIHHAQGLLAFRCDLHGVLTITPQGHLRIPAPQRHRYALAAGDRVLLAAHPSCGVLIVHPPTALDDLLADHHTHLINGDLP